MSKQEPDSSEFLWLLPTVRLDRQSNALRLYGEGRMLEISGLRDVGIPFLALLDGNRTLADLVTHPLAPLILPLLEGANFLVRLRKPVSYWSKWEYKTRQLAYFAHLTRLYPDLALDEISSKAAVIVGAGGIGSHAAYALAAAGIGKLYIVDPDSIEESNLNRQFLYERSDCGLRKVDVLQRSLKNRFLDTNFEVVVSEFEIGLTRSLEPQDRLLLLCADADELYRNPHKFEDWCVVPGGYLGCTAVVGPSCGGREATQTWPEYIAAGREYLTGDFYEGDLHENSWNASSHSINAIAGGVLAEVAIRELCPSLGPPLLSGKRWSCDMRTLVLSMETAR